MEWSERQGDIVSEDIKGSQGLEVKRSVEVEEALQGLNWGNFCLLILISTGRLNSRWLSFVQTLQ